MNSGERHLLEAISPDPGHLQQVRRLGDHLPFVGQPWGRLGEGMALRADGFGQERNAAHRRRQLRLPLSEVLCRFCGSNEGSCPTIGAVSVRISAGWKAACRACSPQNKGVMNKVGAGGGGETRSGRGPIVGDLYSLKFDKQEPITMRNSRWSRTILGASIVALGAFAALSVETAAAAEDSEYKKVDGLAVYLGVAPAEIVKGHSPSHTEQTMHGGAPRGRHEYHVVAAIFEADTGKRVSDAAVTAQISGLGLSGETKKLEPMEIANTISYGGFFDLPGADLYTVALTIQRASAARPVLVNFSYDHRR